METPNNLTALVISSPGIANPKTFDIPSNAVESTIAAIERLVASLTRNFAPPPPTRKTNSRGLVVWDHDPVFFERNPGAPRLKDRSYLASHKEVAEALGVSYARLTQCKASARQGDIGFWCRGHFLRYDGTIN